MWIAKFVLPNGRVDMVLRTETTLYVMELKLDKGRIGRWSRLTKNFSERFFFCEIPIIKIDVSFDSERCNWGMEIMEG